MGYAYIQLQSVLPHSFPKLCQVHCKTTVKEKSSPSLAFSVFGIVFFHFSNSGVVEQYYLRVLIYFSPVTSEIGLFFFYIYVGYWIFSFLDCPFKFLAHFSNGPSAYSLLIYRSYLYFLHSLYNVHKQAKLIYFNFFNTLNVNKFTYTHTPYAQNNWSDLKE